MNPNRKRPLLLLVGLLLLAGLGFGLFLFRQAGSARDRITQALGEPYTLNDPGVRPQSPASPEWSAPSDESPPGNGLLEGLPFPGLPNSDGVSVQETDSAYQFRIPLTDASDADQVSVDVTPHHIRVSGQTSNGKEEDHTPGVSVISSFTQSFDTPQEVLPDQVSRRLERNHSQVELIITIPKKGGGSASEPTQKRELPDLNDFRSPVF